MSHPPADFPPRCLKGIPNAEHLPGEASGASLFLFRDALEPRTDGCQEGSINWLDDEGAIALTLSQRKADNEIQFKAGVAILLREHIDKIAQLPIVEGNLRYERRPLEKNPYHGNLLLPGDVRRGVRRMIEAALALHISGIIPQPEVDSAAG